MSYLPASLRDRLLVADNHHCAYCQTSESNTGQPMSVDHIIPQAQGGKTVFIHMNNPVIVDARRRWVSVGWHPPIDSNMS